MWSWKSSFSSKLCWSFLNALLTLLSREVPVNMMALSILDRCVLRHDCIKSLDLSGCQLDVNAPTILSRLTRRLSSLALDYNNSLLGGKKKYLLKFQKSWKNLIFV
jgi:hypothetical protein